MCTVFAYFGTDIDRKRVEDSIHNTISRGPDDYRIREIKGKGFIAFQRLAIMDLSSDGMQPFEQDGNIAVCNGEIYGFRRIKDELIKKGYSFHSNSDCEILLPLYKEYGSRMFEMLDAEYALVIYDKDSESFVAARDPIGIRPLYYGYGREGGICFASEPKDLVGLCDRIMPFPPGHYYMHGEFKPYTDITKTHTELRSYDEAVILKNIREKLIAGVEKRLDADAPLGFLLSGGLDSSLVCSIASRLLKKKIRTFSIGMTTDAIDLKYAKEVADYLGTEHNVIYMDEQDIRKTLRELIWVLGTYDITTIRASMGMYLMCRAIHETTDVRVLLTGEISDELFGYKYTDFAPSAEAFQQESEKRIRELHAYDVLRADRCIASNSIEARVPFGDLHFVRYVMSIDPKLKLNTHGMGKYLLRKAFEGDWLPEDILWREKAAFSDAVGHSLADDLKAMAEERYPGDDWKELCKKYTYAPPFTKESLMYREIFEEFYPGQDEMIPGYWMPNKDWEGCDVDDPSARVLSNYGKSGE